MTTKKKRRLKVLMVDEFGDGHLAGKWECERVVWKKVQRESTKVNKHCHKMTEQWDVLVVHRVDKSVILQLSP